MEITQWKTAPIADRVFGAVQFTVTGNRRRWAIAIVIRAERVRGPVNAFTLWPEALRITRGAENIGVYNKTPRSDRKFSFLRRARFPHHPHWNLTDVYAAVIPGFKFKPGVHVNYQETVLPMKDGLPKFKDVPAEMGGSGTNLPE
jgi:hypothetical protein